MSAIERWHEHMHAPSAELLWDLLHPDCVFESPVVHTPQRGREITFKYLMSAAVVLGGPSFRYVGEWRRGNAAILEFETEREGIKINGIDMIFADDEDKITRFKVMVRPLKAINMLHQMMAAELMK
jgi:hypothetical protein